MSPSVTTVAHARSQWNFLEDDQNIVFLILSLKEDMQ